MCGRSVGNMLLFAFEYHYYVGTVNRRLPVSANATSMHVPVWIYEVPIFGRPPHYSCIVQYDDDMHMVRTTYRNLCVRNLTGSICSFPCACFESGVYSVQ